MRITVPAKAVRSKILGRPQHHHSSSSASTSSFTMSTRLPPRRYDDALYDLDTAEQARARAATTGRADEAAEQLNQEPHHVEAYRECSYTTRQAKRNVAQNRWIDIYAFDHSLLAGPYLNASLIPPYPMPNDGATGTARRRRSYVASQAPLPHTLTPFYQHIVGHRVRLIVNLTPFRERGRVKADEYWPLQDGKEMSTQSDEEDAAPPSVHYIVRQADSTVLDASLQAKLFNLQVTRHGDDANVAEGTASAPWQVSVLHVTSWPDFGNFDEATFARLLTIIEQQAGTTTDGDDGAPIWVHCSAGVGRSGTVIAALMARELGNGIRAALQLPSDTPVPGLQSEAALVGACKLVDHARRFRPRLVQTGEQLAMVAAVVGDQAQSAAATA